MRFVKRLTGALLAIGIMLGSVGVNNSIVYAKDLGDQSQYCSEELISQLSSIAYEAQEIIHMMNAGVIGWINPDGSRYSMTGNISMIKYQVTGEQFSAFWKACSQHMYPSHDHDPATYHYWQHGNVFSEKDSDGDDNWKEKDGVKYCTAVKKDDVVTVIKGMDEVLRPFRQALASGEKIGDKESSHTHNFVEVTVQEATAVSDKVITMECTICGAQASHIMLPGSAFSQFLKDTMVKLENAPADSSVTIDTEIWTCFNKPVIEALKNRQDIATTVNFRYKGAEYSFTIPAEYGTDKLEELLDENGYCGFMYLVSVFDGKLLTES